MANDQRPIVNQRLYFCRLHLDWLKKQSDEPPLVTAAALEQALGESLLFHLVMAYRAYLRELAAAYNSPVLAFDSAGDLSLELKRQEHDCTEVNELIQLESGDQWLARLLLQFGQLGDVKSIAVNSQRANKEFIVLADVTAMTEDEQIDAIDSQVADYYLNQLTLLIDNQRTRLEEW